MVLLSAPYSTSPSLYSRPRQGHGSSDSLRELRGSAPSPQTSRAVLTAIEGHLIASCVQGLPAAGGAPGRGPGICVGAGPGLHLLLQNQAADSALELGVREDQDEVGEKQTTGSRTGLGQRPGGQIVGNLCHFHLPVIPPFLQLPSSLFHEWS